MGPDTKRTPSESLQAIRSAIGPCRTDRWPVAAGGFAHVKAEITSKYCGLRATMTEKTKKSCEIIMA